VADPDPHGVGHSVDRDLSRPELAVAVQRAAREVGEVEREGCAWGLDAEDDSGDVDHDVIREEAGDAPGCRAGAEGHAPVVMVDRGELGLRQVGDEFSRPGLPAELAEPIAAQASRQQRRPGALMAGVLGRSRRASLDGPDRKSGERGRAMLVLDNSCVWRRVRVFDI